MDVQIYHEWAELEDTHWWFLGRKRIFETIIRVALAGSGPRRICDVGCGAGAMIPILARHGKVWGIESSDLAAEACRKKDIRNLVMARSERLPFKDESLDAIALFDVIEHIDDDERVLEECARICKKQAKLIVSVPSYQFLMSPNDIVADHKRRYNRQNLTAMLEKSGFRVTKATYYNFFLFPLILPIVLMRKLLWRLTGGDSENRRPKGNISYKIPEFVNQLLFLIMRLESMMVRRVNFPFGHSLVCAATKK